MVSSEEKNLYPVSQNFTTNNMPVEIMRLIIFQPQMVILRVIVCQVHAKREELIYVETYLEKST